MDNQRIILLQSLAQTISDYYTGRRMPIITVHIDRWLSQFDREDQFIILHEMDFIMKRFYFSRLRVKSCIRAFIQNLINFEQPEIYLSHVKFVNTRQRGNSQQAMLKLVDEILLEDYDLTLADAGTQEIRDYIYIDDAIYTGNKLRYDPILSEIHSSLLSKRYLTIYVIAAHKAGYNYALKRIQSSYDKFSVRTFASVIIEDDRLPGSNIEVLWPEYVANNSLVDMYVSHLYTPSGRQLENAEVFRRSENTFQDPLFSSARARKIVEKAFLVKGIELIQGNRNPAPSIRPLGFMALASIGFGTCFVTYRNIANNCPLVLWWGDPRYPDTQPLGKWYPLFPRETNNDGIM